MSDPELPILLVEHDADLARLIAGAFLAAGHRTVLASIGAEALRLIKSVPVQLCVLDLSLPDMSGLALLQRLQGVSHVPIIAIVDMHSSDDKVAALDAGAEDCIEKPVMMSELLARIRLLHRRLAHHPEETRQGLITVGRLTISPYRRTAAIDGQDLKLTPLEWHLLIMLAENRGVVVTQRELLDAIWGAERDADAQYLRVLVGRLRGKLGVMARGLQTVTGFGYRLDDS